MLEGSRSDIDQRGTRPTPQKRMAQLAMIKAVQLDTGHERPRGDWIHTAGPNKVSINYVVHEQVFHPDTKYHLVELYPDRADKMKAEAIRLRRKLAEHPWSNKIVVRTDEIFRYTSRRLREGTNVLVIEADLCKQPRTMSEDGIQWWLRQICFQQRYRKPPLFLSLTYSIRNRSNEDKLALREIDAIVGGNKLATTPYKDGCPMETTTWKVVPQY